MSGVVAFMSPGGDTQNPLSGRAGVRLVAVDTHAGMATLAVRGDGVEPDGKAQRGHRVTYDSYHSAQLCLDYNSVSTYVVLDPSLALQ